MTRTPPTGHRMFDLNVLGRMLLICVSYTGKAEIIKDKDVIKKHWSPMWVLAQHYNDSERI